MDLFPGFAVASVTRRPDGSVGGVQIRDRGLTSLQYAFSSHSKGLARMVNLNLRLSQAFKWKQE